MKFSKFIAAFASVATVGFAASSSQAANMLVNPGFEANDASNGDVPGATGWNVAFNANFTSRAVTPHGGLQIMKIFGPFEAGGGAGIGQSGVAATAGLSYTASAFARNDSADALTSEDFGQVQLTFFSAAGANLGTTSSDNITDLSPRDVYIPLSATAIAPAGTATAQILLLKVQLGAIGGGSVFFDDASLDRTAVVPEPASIAALSLAGVGLIARRRRA